MRKGSFLSPKAISRRELLKLAVSASACAATGGFAMATSFIRRPIPRTGELLPAIGLGTWQTFDVGRAASERAPLRTVLHDFAQRGGSVVDSSPMYGESERVVGDLAAELGLHKRLFLATKVWTTGRDAGIRQMKQSMRLLRTRSIDLMQVHNLTDWATHLATLREWKEQGMLRYVGVTHYTKSAYGELARVLETEEPDFVQLNYSLAERDAERQLLPLAASRGVAVLVNRPFAEGALFRKVQGKPLPEWAKEIGCATWAQFFLKFIIAHPAVTCAIPATSKAQHLADNMQAGLPPLPDPAARDRMARYMAEL
jgi:aryl-alcohol dehydrogenase-like predicted oxidoreductase